MKQMFTSLLFVLFLMPAFGQESMEETKTARLNPWEIGGSISASSFAGDLVVPDASSIRATSFSVGAFGRLAIANQFTTRLSLKYGRLSADDTDFPKLENRGFSFTKNFTELTLGFEWEPLGNNPFQADGSFKKRVSPYLYAGIGGVFGSPDINFGSSSIENDPDVQKDLANQRNSHFTVPFGVGVKAYLSPLMTIGGELGLRPVFNDYLDGVSYSGNPDANDWYGVLTFNIGYRLGMEN
ncbi:MAG: hypothetical protein Sapg2KO_53700 [Saprospiraceae bacterium]